MACSKKPEDVDKCEKPPKPGEKQCPCEAPDDGKEDWELEGKFKMDIEVKTKFVPNPPKEEEEDDCPPLCPYCGNFMTDCYFCLHGIKYYGECPKKLGLHVCVGPRVCNCK